MFGENFDLLKNEEILKIASPQGSVSGPYAVVYKSEKQRWANVAKIILLLAIIFLLPFGLQAQNAAKTAYEKRVEQIEKEVALKFGYSDKELAFNNDSLLKERTLN
jgi:hypothetical protein